jgi:pyruvate dehydrogenase E2 component (dihydrolipoamide acetyltransferase)
MSVFVMPSLGADMEDGKLVEWLVKPGDAVHRGDVVAVVETQKGAIEIEIFEDGIVQSLEAELGTTLPVGAPLALDRGWNGGNRAGAETGAKTVATTGRRPASRAG